MEVVIMSLQLACDCSDRNSFGEACGVARCYDSVAFCECGMARYFFKERYAVVIAVPHESSEGIALFDFARDSEVVVKDGNDSCRVRPNNIDFSNDSVLIDNSHVGLDAVEGTFLDGYVVVGTMNGIVDHVRENEVVALKSGIYRMGLSLLHILEFEELLFERQHFQLKRAVAALQILVYISQTEI